MATVATQLYTSKLDLREGVEIGVKSISVVPRVDRAPQHYGALYLTRPPECHLFVGRVPLVNLHIRDVLLLLDDTIERESDVDVRVDEYILLRQTGVKDGEPLLEAWRRRQTVHVGSNAGNYMDLPGRHLPTDQFLTLFMLASQTRDLPPGDGEVHLPPHCG